MELMEAGRILNTHGIKGEVVIEVWTDSAAFLAKFNTLYLEGQPIAVERSRVHKGRLLAKLAGVDTPEAAEALKGRVVFIDKKSAPLEEGQYFLSDLLGLTAVDEAGNQLGKVTDILSRPASELLEITGEREYLIPLIPQFILAHDEETVTVHLIEGL